MTYIYICVYTRTPVWPEVSLVNMYLKERQDSKFSLNIKYLWRTIFATPAIFYFWSILFILILGVKVAEDWKKGLFSWRCCLHCPNPYKHRNKKIITFLTFFYYEEGEVFGKCICWKVGWINSDAQQFCILASPLQRKAWSEGKENASKESLNPSDALNMLLALCIRLFLYFADLLL